MEEQEKKSSDTSSRKKFFDTLLKAQKEITHTLVNDAENPHFNSGYATLDSVITAIKKVCNDNGLLIFQTIGKDKDLGSYVELGVTDGGHEERSRIFLMLDKQSMQGVGSAITYARRYLLVSFFNLAQADDDGNGAGKKGVDNGNKNPQTSGNSNSKKIQAAGQNPNQSAQAPKAQASQPSDNRSTPGGGSNLSPETGSQELHEDMDEEKLERMLRFKKICKLGKLTPGEAMVFVKTRYGVERLGSFTEEHFVHLEKMANMINADFHKVQA